MFGRGGPVLVLTQGTKREHGRKAQLANIQAGKAVSEILRTTLGPKAMLKMLLDPMGGIVMTNDGNAILREIDVVHPAAKSIIELSRCQDEQVGDGTTSVVILAGEILGCAEPFLKKGVHPTVIVSGFMKCLETALAILKEIAVPVNVENDSELLKAVLTCLATKFSSRTKGNGIAQLAIKAARIVKEVQPNGSVVIDIKRYVKVEKIPGGECADSCVLDGVMINKDVIHPRMRRYIKDPKILLVDCPLEYKKVESACNVEITKDEDWEKLLLQEEYEVRSMCDKIILSGCNLVVAEKGVSDLAQHFLSKENISILRRVRKTDTSRIAKISGATVISRLDEILESDVGQGCGMFEVKKIGDDYYSFFSGCRNPHACTVLLRGASKDVLNEIERNFQDAVNVCRNIMLDCTLVPGGGATEMEIASRLRSESKGLSGIHQWPYKALGSAFEVIPRTLAQNCGGDVVRTITELRSMHATPNIGKSYGIDGINGQVVDTEAAQIWDVYSVKQQVFRTAIEASCMLLRIDDVLSGISKKGASDRSIPKVNNYETTNDEKTFGDSRDG